MTKTALIFPGQGAQVVGMGQDVAKTSAAARAIFDRANELLGFDLATLCFQGPAEELERTDIQQPAIFTTSVALWAALQEAGVQLAAFDRCGGLSLGEYTALQIAGAVGFEDGLRLVRRRGELMQEAALTTPSGMVSLIGADAESAEALCARAREDVVLSPANFNCPGQVVVSGHRDACARAVALADEFNCRAVALPVAGAFHSPYMQPAGDGLAAVLAEVALQTPAIPVVANINAEYHGEAAQMRDWLRRQVTEAVQWQKCIERMRADGVERFVEVGPGRVLTGLLRKIDRKLPAVNVSSTESLAKAAAELGAG